MSDKRIETIARVCHEVNRAYCQSMGDSSQVAWDEAPQWQRDSVRDGVRLHIENPSTTPEDSHRNWCGQKVRDGWGYGPVKAPERKEHPCLVDYAKLPVEQRAKDYIFLAVVRTLVEVLP